MSNFNNWMQSVKQEQFVSDLMKACKGFKLAPIDISPQFHYGATLTYSLSLDSFQVFDFHQMVSTGQELVNEICQMVIVQGIAIGLKDGKKVLTMNDNNISNLRRLMTEYLMDIKHNALYKTLFNDMTRYPENSTRHIYVCIESYVVDYMADTYVISVSLGTSVAVLDEDGNILDREEVRNQISEAIRKDKK